MAFLGNESVTDGLLGIPGCAATRYVYRLQAWWGVHWALIGGELWGTVKGVRIATGHPFFYCSHGQTTLLSCHRSQQNQHTRAKNQICPPTERPALQQNSNQQHEHSWPPNARFKIQ
jgi:hypothetical protein